MTLSRWPRWGRADRCSGTKVLAAGLSAAVLFGLIFGVTPPAGADRGPPKHEKSEQADKAPDGRRPDPGDQRTRPPADPGDPDRRPSDRPADADRRPTD